MHKITVAICTYRRYRLLEKCLNSLKHQTQPLSGFRIIVIDNSLQPSEGAAFRDNIKGLPNLDYFITTEAGIAFARTFAVEQTNTEYVAFIDDDSIANNDWVEKMISAVDRHKPNAGAIGGKVLPLWDVEKPNWFPDDMLGALAVVDWGDNECEIDEKFGNWLVSTNIAYKVDAVKQIHGFRKALGRNKDKLICHEELDLHIRLKKAGYNIIYCPELIVNHKIHENRLNKEFICDLMFSEGYSRAMMEEIEGEQFKHLFPLYNTFLPPAEVVSSNLFTDTNDPAIFKKKMIAISDLGRILFHSKRVIDRAPEWCFIPKNDDSLNAKRVEAEFLKNNCDESLPIKGALTINELLPSPIYRECDFINSIWFVIPCLNAANTIEETLNSIFAQEGNFTLHLHVQDGQSTDGTIEIIKKWQEKAKQNENPKILMTFNSSNDSGMYDAINNGFKQLNVPDDGYMTWLNADDILHPGTLNTVIEVAKKFRYTHWVCGTRSSMPEDGINIWKSKFCDCLRYNILNGNCDNKHYPYMQQEGTFWRGWLWNYVGGVNSKLKLAGDYDLWTKFASVAELYPINRTLATFRFRNGSLSSNKEAYSTEVDSIKGIDERNKQHHQLIRLLSEGYIMLSPVIEYDNQNNKLTISWKNSIESLPALKDDLISYYQKSRTVDSSNIVTYNDILNTHKLPQLPHLAESKWIGSKVWTILYLNYWHRKQAATLKESKYFDESWYLENNVDVEIANVNPAMHFITDGALEGRNPSLDFDTRFYLNSYPDVKASGLNPLYHYIKFGEKENRNKNVKEMAQKSHTSTKSKINIEMIEAKKSLIVKIKSLIVDFKTYKTIFFSGLFQPTYYAEQNKDIIDANINPLWHYIKCGDMEGRKPNPLFDPTWYRTKYPDLSNHQNMNALLHYYKFGAKEGRNPSSDFLSNEYLFQNPDVYKKGTNPLVHYLQNGIREGRKKQEVVK